MAHQGALPSGTIGVLAGGIDIVYPPEHADLQAEIANGCLVTEMPMGSCRAARTFAPQPHRVGHLVCVLIVGRAAQAS
jgi:DNA processing protein